MTSTLRFRRLLRLALSWGLLFALCLACTYEEGERSSSGGCPEGETCSDATPSGLTFYGPPRSDGETTFLPRLAMGGAQNVAYDSPDGADLGDAAADSSAPWLMTVEPADPDRDVHAVWDGEDHLRLSGLAEGEAYLRVTDADTGALHDRVQITVERVSSVEAVDLEGAALSLAAGDHATVVFRLLGASGERLVDESMTVASETAFERSTWDSVELDVPDVDEVTFTLEAGHRRWAVTLPVAR